MQQSQLFLPVFISWEEAQNYARQYLVGEEFSKNQFSVKVMEVFLREQNQKIVIQLTTSGTYDGEIRVILQPVFHPEHAKIDFVDTQLEMDTKSIFQKGVVLLLKGILQSQLEKILDFDLKQVLEQVIEKANQQLQAFTPAPGVRLKGNIDLIDLKSLSYNAIGLKLEVVANGQMELGFGNENITIHDLPN